MRYLSGFFWGLSWYVFTINLNHFEFLVYLSVCLLAYFLTEIMSIWGYLQFWMRYHSEFFWRHSWDISVCQPVSQSLIYLPIGHFWGSTSETSGLVGPKHDPYTLPGTAGYWHCFGGSIQSPLRFAWLWTDPWRREWKLMIHHEQECANLLLNSK